MTTPVRRLSPAVYRRRRLAVLAVLLTIAAVVWLLVAQPWRGFAAEQPRVASTPSASPVATTPPATGVPTASAPAPTAAATAPPEVAATPGATPVSLSACTVSDLTVEALTDASEYAPGQNPLLSIRLTNRSSSDCTMNVGTTGQTFTITSGSDVWWRSTDCQTESADQTVTLAAGQTVTSATPVTWDRTRSSVDSCGGERQAAPGGGATYRLTTSIGGVPSTSETVFFLY